MAERRMFAKTIIDSDAFLDMPLSAQALYFHLSMRADDEGFVNNPKKIQRMIGAADDDIKLLILKRFVIPFHSGVCVIKHWLIHNYIRGDRFKPTVYAEEKNALIIKENKVYSMPGEDTEEVGIPDDIPVDGNRDTQVRLGKVRVGKDRLGKGRLGECEGENAADEPPDLPEAEKDQIPYEAVRGLYNQLCQSLPKCTALSTARRKAIRARFSSGYNLDDFQTLFEKAGGSAFLLGKNPRNWAASFDWLIKDSSMPKVLDGNYDDRSGQGTGFQTANPFLELLEEELHGQG